MPTYTIPTLAKKLGLPSLADRTPSWMDKGELEAIRDVYAKSVTVAAERFLRGYGITSEQKGPRFTIAFHAISARDQVASAYRAYVGGYPFGDRAPTENQIIEAAFEIARATHLDREWEETFLRQVEEWVPARKIGKGAFHEKMRFKMLYLDEDAFISRFKPEQAADGSYYRQRQGPADLTAIKKARDENRIWTAVDTNGGLYLLSGYHTVNREYYVITQVPWEEDIEVVLADYSEMERMAIPEGPSPSYPRPIPPGTVKKEPFYVIQKKEPVGWQAQSSIRANEPDAYVRGKKLLRDLQAAAPAGRYRLVTLVLPTGGTTVGPKIEKMSAANGPSEKTILAAFKDLWTHDGRDPKVSARRLKQALAGSWKAAMEEANTLLGGHGVEYLPAEDDDFRSAKGVEYVNMGDTYTTTLLYDRTSRRYIIGSWGDLVERNPKRFR